MSNRNRLTDPTQTHFIVTCPACEQKYAILGLMVQDKEEMACSACNAIFKLEIAGKKVETKLLTPSTGVGFGPAEGPERH